MEKMINLRDLLVHEIQDLYSAEEQIIEALPAMIEKAGNKELKKSLQEHLKVTEKQKERLDQVKQLLGGEMGEERGEGNEGNGGQKKGFFSRLFKGSGGHHCRGMEGLIEEGEKVMAEDMTPEVLDAAIIASAQKIEHYEICGYGTARAYARELNLGEVAELLEETLDEEYEADDLLTDLAVGRLNEQAEKGEAEGRGRGRKTSSRSGGSSGSQGKSNSNAKKSASRSSSGSRSTASRSNSGGKSSKSAASAKGGSKSSGGGNRGKSSAGRSRASRAKAK